MENPVEILAQITRFALQYFPDATAKYHPTKPRTVLDLPSGWAFRLELEQLLGTPFPAPTPPDLDPLGLEGASAVLAQVITELLDGMIEPGDQHMIVDVPDGAGIALRESRDPAWTLLRITPVIPGEAPLEPDYALAGAVRAILRVGGIV